MKLNFLGNGSAFNPENGSTGAYFVHGNSLFILDCGESVFENIFEVGAFKKCSDIYVLITHLHSDHVGSLGSLISYCQLILKKKIYIIHPQVTITDYLSLIGINKEFYVFVHDFPVILGDVIINAFPVNHVDDLKSYGYAISADNESIYYSGDASNIPENILTKFNNHEINTIYQDTSSHISTNHLTLDKLTNIISVENRKRVFCMHLDIDSEDLIKNKGFNIADIAPGGDKTR